MPEGYLLLGTAESLVNLNVPLELALLRNARFYHYGGAQGKTGITPPANKSAHSHSEMA